MAEANQAVKPKRNVSIDPSRMGLAEYHRSEWVANAPEGVTVEDITEPGFWSLMASQMSPYDRVEVRADDGTWVAECLVTGCDRTWAKVHVLAVHKLSSADVSQTQSAKYLTKYRGPQNKWSVIRQADQVAIKEGCQTQDEAIAWMKEHEKTVA